MRRRKTLLSQNTLLEIFQRMEKSTSRFSDGRILAGLARMAYYCGLRKEEFIDLKVGDILAKAGGGIVDEIKTKSGNILIDDRVRGFLQGHLDYLRRKGYRVSPTFPLFPAPIKKTIRPGAKASGRGKYGSRKLQRDLREAAPEFSGREVSWITSGRRVSVIFMPMSPRPRIRKTA